MEVFFMARKPTADKEITRVEEKKEGLLWLLKATEHEILERLNQDGALIFIHPALDGIVSFRIEENPAHDQKVVHVWR
jgi:hypothetical protein